jgi:hypothetical protein
MRKYADRWLKSLSVMSSESLSEKRRLAEMMSKIGEEENRYAKAYGAGTLDFDRFQELMKDAKKRKLIYQRQLNDLADKSTKNAIGISVDELVKGTGNLVKNLDFTDKFKIVRDIIDKVIVSEGSGVEVWAHLSLPALITEKLGYEPISWSRWPAQCR